MDASTAMALGSSIAGMFGKSGPSLSSLNKQAEVQYVWQRKLNQTAIQDKVRDAELAGIHPLYAISGQTNQGGISMPTGSENSTGRRFSEMGQNIERAVSATGDKRQRALMEKSLMLDIESKQINNDILKSQAVASRGALMRQAGQPPSMPSVEHAPTTIKGQNVENKSQQAGQPPSHQYLTLPNNRYLLTMSEAAKQLTEDDMMSEIPWHINHRFIPPKPPYNAPQGKIFTWNPLTQAWTLTKKRWYHFKSPFQRQ